MKIVVITQADFNRFQERGQRVINLIEAADADHLPRNGDTAVGALSAAVSLMKHTKVEYEVAQALFEKMWELTEPKYLGDLS